MVPEQGSTQWPQQLTGPCKLPISPLVGPSITALIYISLQTAGQPDRRSSGLRQGRLVSRIKIPPPNLVKRPLFISDLPYIRQRYRCGNMRCEIGREGVQGPQGCVLTTGILGSTRLQGFVAHFWPIIKYFTRMRLKDHGLPWYSRKTQRGNGSNLFLSKPQWRELLVPGC